MKLDDGRGADDPLHLIVEVTGEKKHDKLAKVETAKTLWVPAVNAEGAFGRWDFLEIDAATRHAPMKTIRRFLADRAGVS